MIVCKRKNLNPPLLCPLKSPLLLTLRHIPLPPPLPPSPAFSSLHPPPSFSFLLSFPQLLLFTSVAGAPSTKCASRAVRSAMPPDLFLKALVRRYYAKRRETHVYTLVPITDPLYKSPRPVLITNANSHGIGTLRNSSPRHPPPSYRKIYC